MKLTWLNDVFNTLPYDLYEAKIKKDTLGELLTIEIEKAGYITFEDCQVASKHISDALEKLDPESDLRIEVASAGAERSLKTYRNYLNAIGKTVCVKTETASFNGTIDEVQPSILILKLKEKTITIPFDTITDAHLTIVL